MNVMPSVLIYLYADVVRVPPSKAFPRASPIWWVSGLGEGGEQEGTGEQR